MWVCELYKQNGEGGRERWRERERVGGRERETERGWRMNEYRNRQIDNPTL